ncbi:hypothetical protein [Psychroserpens algicola]|uniref:STAS/SEC14 domain-containing protein n=1 Tax=Psychroserpens algicola TaxID=1719034 RepID=A0ABT0H8S1_9FLAO|nr:hypothetical protein [Psychroserpens algicola]MCK8480765.1 hypothetical protein [Psychroserpens algicola]
MLLIESKHYDKLIHQETVAIGDLYFFKNYLVAEFNEGINITYENFDDAKTAIQKYYGNTSFGFIANRKKSYSILITDAPFFNETFKNLKAYATVTYSSFASKVFEMENHFFKFNRQNFNELDDAIQWVESHFKDASALV